MQQHLYIYSTDRGKCAVSALCSADTSNVVLGHTLRHYASWRGLPSGQALIHCNCVTPDNINATWCASMVCKYVTQELELVSRPKIVCYYDKALKQIMQIKICAMPCNLSMPVLNDQNTHSGLRHSGIGIAQHQGGVKGNTDQI